ncbi:MAG: hypothetical protein R3B81_02560 [bacterium]
MSEARAEPVDRRTVMRTWWPLAASWLMMGFELPAVGAVMARLADPEVSLAAYGGVVFPLALLIEAPIIMLLSASTALSRDVPSYRKLRRFMALSAGALTLLHLLVATTPLWDVVVGHVLSAPEETRAPARLGMLLMTPWSGAIAYRRFQQGVLIRSGRSGMVGIGTLVRLAANGVVLTIGSVLGGPGIAVGTGAVAAGVTAEALFIGLAVRPVLRRLPAVDPTARPLTRKSFVAFYTPLALTSLLALAVLPIGAAAMGRLPRAIDSLAAWPVVNGLTFTLRSLGFAFNEVVVTLIERPGGYAALRSFARTLATIVSGLLLLIAATPLASLYFSGLSGLAPPLASLAGIALWIAIPMPALSVLQSWHTGILVNRHRTRGVGEAIAIALLTVSGMLAALVGRLHVPGLPPVLAVFVFGQLVQVVWLARRSAADRLELAAGV